MSDALFEPLGSESNGTIRVLPTGFSRGPWSPDALHGGPVAVLAARQAEEVLTETFDGRFLPTRFTIDLERPVPLRPLTVSTEIVRPGRKVQVAEVVIFDEKGQRLARASVLAIRARPVERPADLVSPDDPVPPAPPATPSGMEGWEFPSSDVVYHLNATEHRVVRGILGEPGPVTDWISLVVPAVAGETPSPLQRVAAASDFLNGVSWVLSGAEWLFINPDLTVTLHRLPVGGHVAIEAVTRIGPDGTGTAEANLYDTEGRIGRAVQTLLVQPR